MTKKQKLHILLLFLLGTLIPITVGIAIGRFIWDKSLKTEVIIASIISLIPVMLVYIVINCGILMLAYNYYKEDNND